MAREEHVSQERPLRHSLTNAVPASKDVQPPCPYCGTEMEAGQVAVHTIFWRWLTLGESSPDCWFQPRDSHAEEVLVPSAGSRPALRCRRCQSVLIPGRAFQPRQAAQEPAPETVLAELFRKAGRLAQQGDWALAAGLYEQLAEQLEGKQDGDYARRRAQEMRTRLAQVKKE